MKKLIKKLLKLKYLNLIYTYVYHAIQRRRYYGIINKYDDECPLMGKLRERGYRVMAFAQDNLYQLQNFRKDQVIYLDNCHLVEFTIIIRNIFEENGKKIS